jgi:cullin 1
MGSAPLTVAEMLSTYSDNILRKNGLKVPPDQFEAHLEKIVQLFSYLSDKDIFIASFKNFLARRLLSERSESVDYERVIVTKLKINCGRTVTDGIEGMMNDLELGKELSKKYQDQRALKESDGPVEFDVKILTLAHWPAYKSF